MHVTKAKVLLVAWLLVFGQSLLLVHTHEADAYVPDADCEVCLHLSFLDKSLVSETAVDSPKLVDTALRRDFLPKHFPLFTAPYHGRAPPPRPAV